MSQPTVSGTLLIQTKGTYDLYYVKWGGQNEFGTTKGYDTDFELLPIRLIVHGEDTLWLQESSTESSPLNLRHQREDGELITNLLEEADELDEADVDEVNDAADDEEGETADDWEELQ